MEYQITKPLLQWCRRFVDGYFDPGCCLTLDELAKRIYSNAVRSGVVNLPPMPTPSNPFSANLPSPYLAWNKNTMCAKTWDVMIVPLEGKYKLASKTTSYLYLYLSDGVTKHNKYDWTLKSSISSNDWKAKNSHGWERSGKDKCLIVTRHKFYLKTITQAEYVKNYCIKSKSLIAFEGGLGDTRRGFWLINDQDSPFVYAILKSSMFKAWCELTAHTDGGEGDFTTGMWDTFPLPKLTNSRKSLIRTAGQELQEGYGWGQKKLDESVDSLFAPTCSTHVLSDRCRKRILAEGFLDAFYGL